MISSLLRRKRKGESWFKYVTAVLHLWLGLLSSLIIVVVCITGSIYAFRQPLQNMVNYKFLYATPHEQRQSLDSIVADFEKRFERPSQLILHPEAARSIWITSSAKDHAGVSAYYSPYTGEMLGTSNESLSGFLEVILDIHRYLLAGDTGKFVVGVAVLIFLFMLLSGFVLWVPRKVKHLKDGLRILWRSRFYRFNYDLHRVLGFYSLPLLFFVALTGLYVSFHWIKNAVIISLGGTSIVISEENTALQNELAESFTDLFKKLEAENRQPIAAIALDTLLAQADKQSKAGGVKIVAFPSEHMAAYQVTRMNSFEVIGFAVPDVVEFSAHGELRSATRFNELPLHEQFKAIAKPFHTGEIFGVTGIILYSIVSLIGSSLPITGFIIWYKKNKRSGQLGIS